jgi:urease accessory protein
MTRLDGDIAKILSRKAVAGGAVAVASIIYAAPDAASRLAALRTALQGCEAGVSAFEGIVFIRLLAPSAISLRICVVAALKFCRNGAVLPRVWQG